MIGSDTATVDTLSATFTATGTALVADVARSALRHLTAVSARQDNVAGTLNSDPSSTSTAPTPPPPFAASDTLNSLTSPRPAHSPSPSERASGMQKWEGRIVDVTDDLITVELTPLEDSGPTLVADFQRSLLGDDDAEIATDGDIVYVTVRIVRSADHGPSVTSAIRLRRLGNWTVDEVRAVHERAARRQKALQTYVD